MRRIRARIAAGHGCRQGRGRLTQVRIRAAATASRVDGRRSAAVPRTGQTDGGVVRGAILAAARSEFAARGLKGARVQAIAERAGCNKQLLYYYFGSKDGLYRAALESVYADIRAQEQGLELGGLPPADAMAALVGFSFDYLAAHPEFIGLLNHENALGAPHVRASRAVRETNSPLVDLIASTLRRGVADGLFRRGVDPVALYISIAGMAYFFFSNRRTLEAVFARDLSASGVVAGYRRHVVALAMAGLLRCGKGRQAHYGPCFNQTVDRRPSGP